MTVLDISIYLLDNEISAAQKALILFLIFEVIFNPNSPIFYKNWKQNWKIMPNR